ncbi:MAG TPA: hypothetical protein VH394_22505, partial [Thermoanaerobaculia bacterium]|nr:hypothetical protein [Thermoanaerobaculia bacterium]
AVRLWNGAGRFFGPKHKIIRAMMLDPDNYVLEDGSLNMSKGAKLGHTMKYEDPVLDTFDKVKGDKKKLAAWRKAFRAARKKYLANEWSQLKIHVPKLAH